MISKFFSSPSDPAPAFLSLSIRILPERLRNFRHPNSSFAALLYTNQKVQQFIEHIDFCRCRFLNSYREIQFKGVCSVKAVDESVFLSVLSRMSLLKALKSMLGGGLVLTDYQYLIL